MTFYQWVTFGFGIAGFLITWIGGGIGGVIAMTRAIETIKQDVSQRIADEVLARTKALSDAVQARNDELEELRREFTDAQRTQDHNFGEMGAALRRFIETVEKEMHNIEIWGRDNYVQKGEFEKATDSIRADIREMGSEIKTDLRALTAKIDAKH